MKRSAKPRRKTPLKRTSLRRGSPPRRKGLAEDSCQRFTETLTRARQPQRTTRIRPVSRKRARENRQRAAMAAALYPERPLCDVYVLSQQRPGLVPARVLARCTRWGDDLHEPLTRARGGSITDPENARTPCRPCHGAVQLGPEWAYTAGLMAHSWDRLTPRKDT